MKNQTRSTAFVLLSLMFLMLSFQNCSSGFEAIEFGQSDSSSTSGNEPSPEPTPEPTPEPIPSNKPMLGVFRGELFNGIHLVDNFEAWMGEDLDMAQAHQPKDRWESIEAVDQFGNSWQLPNFSKWVNAKPGRILNYSVSMYPEHMGQGGLARCASGEFDSHYEKLADNLVKYELQNSILRLGWEFSGNWMPWYAGNGQEENFAGCFRRIVQRMRAAQPEAGFKFDWNPNYDIDPNMLEKAWPGDEYVDYVGIDIYDYVWNGAYPYPDNCDDACRLEKQKYAFDTWQIHCLNRVRDFAKSHGKQLSFPEWGLVAENTPQGGGDNPYFMKQMLDFIYNPDNNVGYHSYFDIAVAAGDLRHQISDAAEDGSRTYVTVFPKSAQIFLDYPKK